MVGRSSFLLYGAWVAIVQENAAPAEVGKQPVPDNILQLILTS